MSKLPNDCIYLFYFQVGWGGRGVVWGWPYLINSLQKKHKKHRQSPSCIVKFLQILCSSCIFWFWLFLVVLGEGCSGIRRIRYYNFFPKHSFLFFYYHKMNLFYSFIISKILVYIFNFFVDKTLKFNRKGLSHKLCYISGIFDNIFRWTFFLERDISYGKVKGKGVIFFNWP